LLNTDPDGDWTQPDLVTVGQVMLWIMPGTSFLRRLAWFALADLHTVHVGAVAAPEIPNAGVRRIDVEEAVVPGHGTVRLVVLYPRLAVVCPAEYTGGPLLEGERERADLSRDNV
jgi:hypothetical protein